MRPRREGSNGWRWAAVAVLSAAVAAAGASGAIVEGAAVEELAWLAGCWRSGGAEQGVEECWMAPRGGVMLGVNRTVSPRRTAFEFLRIANEGNGLAYIASPAGAPPTAFALVELGERRVVFANPEHDFPQRVLYWMEGEELRARVDGEVDGELQAIDFAWQRATGW